MRSVLLALLVLLAAAPARGQNTLTAPTAATLFDAAAGTWTATSMIGWSEDGPITDGVRAYVDNFPPVTLHDPAAGIVATCEPSTVTPLVHEHPQPDRRG